jgi:photosystem I reaction center subunit V
MHIIPLVSSPHVLDIEIRCIRWMSSYVDLFKPRTETYLERYAHHILSIIITHLSYCNLVHLVAFAHKITGGGIVQVSKQGLPEQNGVTHFEAGDSRAQEVVGMLKTNDPAGFTLVDVLAWGALGHAIGFFILATANNGYTPTF